MRLTFGNGILVAACLGALAGCGAGDNAGGFNVSAQAKQLHRSAKAQVSSYETTVQELYISYFGRPADPAGLTNFEAALQAAGAPTDIQTLVPAYNNNSAVKALIDRFGSSRESQLLYGSGTVDDFVTAVFQHVLNRAPQPTGLAYWSKAISGGSLSQSDAALAIMAGALANTTPQGLLDAQLIQNRLNVAADFTASVSNENAVGAYRGAPAANIARAMLSDIVAASTGNYQSTIDATIASLPTPLSFSFSAYKEITTGGMTNSYVMQTSVYGNAEPQTNAMSAHNPTLTWAFAAGNCGSESWDGIDGASFAAANVPAFVNAGKYYIVSTGGWAQQFKCTSDAGFTQFLQRYYSSSMLGVDFDIEGGSQVDWTQTDVDNLVQRVMNAQKIYPNLRFSFTVGTTGGSANGLSSYGQMVLDSISYFGMKNYLINLMVMDYGPGASSDICVVSNGQCDMGSSAVQAAVNLHAAYGVPYNQIELTPMIGQNDSVPDIFLVSDIATVSSFVNSNALAGVHFWSFDRDVDCPYDPNGPSGTCNGVGNAGTLGFTGGFIYALGL